MILTRQYFERTKLVFYGPCKLRDPLWGACHARQVLHFLCPLLTTNEELRGILFTQNRTSHTLWLSCHLAVFHGLTEPPLMHPFYVEIKSN